MIPPSPYCARPECAKPIHRDPRDPERYVHAGTLRVECADRRGVATPRARRSGTKTSRKVDHDCV